MAWNHSISAQRGQKNINLTVSFSSYDPSNKHTLELRPFICEMGRVTLSSATPIPVDSLLSNCRQNHTQACTFDIITIKHVISHVQAEKRGKKRENKSSFNVDPSGPPTSPEVITPSGLFRVLNFKP